MHRVAMIIALTTPLLGCGRQVQPTPETPASKAARPAPGPAVGDPPPSLSPHRGKMFRMKANGAMPNPAELKKLVDKGGPLPPGVEEVKEPGPAERAAAEADNKAKDAAVKLVTEIYGMIAGKPMDVLEVTRAHGLWRVTFQTRGVKEAPSTVHLSKDGELAFEGGYELKQRYDKLKIDHNFAQCLAVRGVRIIGDGRDRASVAQLKEIGAFGGRVFVDCGRAKGGCKALMAKLKLKKLPVIEQGEDRFTGPRPRSFLETLSGCK